MYYSACPRRRFFVLARLCSSLQDRTVSDTWSSGRYCSIYCGIQIHPDEELQLPCPLLVRYQCCPTSESLPTDVCFNSGACEGATGATVQYSAFSKWILDLRDLKLFVCQASWRAPFRGSQPDGYRLDMMGFNENRSSPLESVLGNSELPGISGFSLSTVLAELVEVVTSVRHRCLGLSEQGRRIKSRPISMYMILFRIHDDWAPIFPQRWSGSGSW